MKPDQLLSVLNQIKKNIQFTMEKTQIRHPLLDIMINKSGTKIWMDICSKPKGSERHVPFTSNQPRCCLRILPFSFARRICIIAANENIKKRKRLKELKKTFLKQKHPKSLTENIALAYFK